MNWSLLFTIAIALILLRVFWLHIKANSAKTESFQRLPAKDKMAVLKECLLNSPAELNLQNLKEFCDGQGLPFDADGYRPFIKKQLDLSKTMANYVECDALYVQACAYIDQLKPMDFAEAETAFKNGDQRTYVERSLEGISRLYSDKAIEEALTALTPAYPKANKLLESYRELAKACNESGAEDDALEKLRKQRDAWLEDLLSIDR